MSRYKIALLNSKKLEKKAFHFPKTGSVIKVTKYIDYCQAHNGIFVANNISEDILDSAVLSVCRYHNIPLVVESESIARAFSISYSFKFIYTYETVPTDIYVNNKDDRDRYVICYNSDENRLPVGLRAMVVIYGKEKSNEILSL